MALAGTEPARAGHTLARAPARPGSLFLHRDPATMPDAQRAVLRELHESDGALTGKRVLIVDDDMRNIFALTRCSRTTA